MTDPLTIQVVEALAAQIQANLAGTADPVIEGLQVDPLLNPNPTPPSIDIYPADPFQESIAYGKANNNMRWLVRARVSTTDHQDGQRLLLSMMDPVADESMALAILQDRTLGGKVEHVHVEGPSDYGRFTGSDGDYLGCTWTAVVTP